MSILKKIKDVNFQAAIEEGVDLNLLYLLEKAQELYNLDSYTHVKIQGWVSGLKRKGLLSEEGKITLEGANILTILDNDLGKSTLKKISIENNEDFKKWWTIYPSNNNFEYNNRKFPGIRKMRVQEKDCEVLFYKLINEEGFKAEDIINGTANHIELAKKLSYSEKVNKLTYIPSSPRYLREKMFEPYIDKKEPPKEDKESYI